MDRQYETIRRLLGVVRARYRALTMCQAIVRAALAASAIVGLSLVVVWAASFVIRSPWLVAVAGLVAVLSVLAAVVWGLKPLARAPSDARIARFIEERVPELEDRLATAVDVAGTGTSRASVLIAPLVADVARRAAGVDVDDVVPRRQLRRGGVLAVAATMVFLMVAIVARGPARQSVDAASLVLFPERIHVDVRPGDALVRAGTALTVDARIAGNRAPVSARLEVRNGESWQSTEMSADAGSFRASLAPAVSDFQYRVVAGTLVSPTYSVKVAYPPRVTRIDVDYVYPPALDLRPRTETDGGDVYAPAGTDVRLHIYADRPAATGRLSMSNGASIALSSATPTEMTATLKVSNDGSYRVALADRDGMTDGEQTEYFIRLLDDRPPEVHIVKPASDRSVTPLEEVDIEAQADDDYGLDRVELVYAVRGQQEKAVTLDVPKRATTASVRHTLYLEDLGVKPGDFVSYYVRARDITRSTRSESGARSGQAAHANEGRSDIFFLEVRPYEQEFSLAQSQSMAGGGYAGSIDDLVNAQKQIVVATWKLDRRAAGTNGPATPLRAGARSPQDIRAVGRSEAELKTRAEEAASSLRESTMRDPRRRLQGRGSEPDGLRIGQTMPEEDAMAKAVEAMERAVTALEALNTTVALPPEMQALNALLEAQALVKKRQISRQQSAQGGPGNNNRNYDISTLFDRELQRLQETNYETRQPAGRNRPAPGDDVDAAEKVRSLARRQDELLKRQEELARLPSEEKKRQLERLTREQTELRREAEEMARAGRGGDETSRQLQQIADDMRSATDDLRRPDSAGSRSRGRQALDRLRNLERRLSGAAPDERRARGDVQSGADGKGQTTRELSQALNRVRELREKLDAMANELQRPGTGGRQNRLRDEAARELQRARELIDELRRQDPSLGRGGPGLTFEGRGMTFSSPGNEGFKQDFSKWEALREQATAALSRVESSISNRLQQRLAADRLAAGIDDTPPEAYRTRVDDYFKAIASKKAP
jgi:hypothetical protein